MVSVVPDRRSSRFRRTSTNLSCPLPADAVDCPIYDEANAEDVEVILFADLVYSLDADLIPGGGVSSYRQVYLHELGHAMGLLHENRNLALMNDAQRPARNVGLMPDDVRAARTHYPAADTGRGDRTIMGFANVGGQLFRATADPADGRPLRAGLDEVGAAAFVIWNRSPLALDRVPARFFLGDVEIGVATCDLAPYEGCAANGFIYVPVPDAVPDGVHRLTVAVDTLEEDEILPDDNVLYIADITVIGVENQDRDEDGQTPAQGDCDDAASLC